MPARQGDFTTKQVPVVREKLTDEKANLRFYADMPNVAYMNIAEFYKLQLPKGTMDAKIQDDGTWLLRRIRVPMRPRPWRMERVTRRWWT